MARIGLALAGGMSPTDIVDCVKHAEDLGYESAWFAEGHGGDQFSILTACALATHRILLGTSISSIFVRSAPTIAMAAACVDYYSQQRFILGLGSSHKVQVEPEHSIPYGQPVQRMRETVAIIRTLLREGEVSYQGEVLTIEHFDLWFQPTTSDSPGRKSRGNFFENPSWGSRPKLSAAVPPGLKMAEPFANGEWSGTSEASIGADLNFMLDEAALRQKKHTILISQTSGNFSCAHNAVSTLTGDPLWTLRRSPASIRYTRKTLLR